MCSCSGLRAAHLGLAQPGSGASPGLGLRRPLCTPGDVAASCGGTAPTALVPRAGNRKPHGQRGKRNTARVSGQGQLGHAGSTSGDLQLMTARRSTRGLPCWLPGGASVCPTASHAALRPHGCQSGNSPGTRHCSGWATRGRGSGRPDLGWTVLHVTGSQLRASCSRRTCSLEELFLSPMLGRRRCCSRLGQGAAHILCTGRPPTRELSSRHSGQCCTYRNPERTAPSPPDASSLECP